MTERKWGLITSGATFESLVTTLVFFEDQEAALFGRRGVDGGQDVRSGDGSRVFQAKHVTDQSTAKAIRHAKKEATKITKIRENAEHPRYRQWEDVTHWRFVTNVPFNPTDEQKWDDEVVPLFDALELEADYWEQATLEGLLDKHPEVARAYFENETRALLSLPEIEEQISDEEPFLRRTELPQFMGRDSEIDEIKRFLRADELCLLVHGAGGVGKTRLLLEAGQTIAVEDNWQVLWAKVETMTASSAWFDSITPERPTLLIVDEPEDSEILKLLFEQLGRRFSRTSEWKMAVTARSPKDPVLQFLSGPRIKRRVTELPIEPLPETDGVAICRNLLRSGTFADAQDEWIQETAATLAKRFSNQPIWLTLAVHLLEEEGNLAKVPETAAGLAEQYVDEIVNRQVKMPPKQVLDLLQWHALLGTVNREDNNMLHVLQEGAGFLSETELKGALARLVNRRAIVQRGARERLVEVKPDVIRDHLLLRWLTIDVGYGDSPLQPSPAATSLVEVVAEGVSAGVFGDVQEAILQSVARTERLLELSERRVDLLGHFFQRLSNELNQLTASIRRRLAVPLTRIAIFRPIETLKLCRALRTTEVETEVEEGLLGAREVTHDTIVLELAWVAYHAAMGARTNDQARQVISELCELIIAEHAIADRRPRGLPNDGKRADGMLDRALAGGPEFWIDFTLVAGEVAEQLLDRISRTAPSGGQQVLLSKLLEPLLSLERRQTWSEDWTVHIRTVVIQPDQPQWQIRENLLEEMKDVLEDDAAPLPSRQLLWSLFATTHKNAHRARPRVSGEFSTKLRDSLIGDLRWAQSILSKRAANFEELVGARDLWEWHYKFNENQDFRDAAEALESLYQRHSLAEEFEPLFGFDDLEKTKRNVEKKAVELASNAPRSIEEFLARGTHYLGGEGQLYRLQRVTWFLGRLARSEEGIQEFVEGGLAAAEASVTTEFAIYIAVSWISAVRREEHDLRPIQLVKELCGYCDGEERQVDLLNSIYNAIPLPAGAGGLPLDEFRFLTSKRPLFLKLDRTDDFIGCLGWSFLTDWDTYKEIIEDTVEQLSAAQLLQCVVKLIDAVFWSIREIAVADAPDDLATWFLDQVLRLPDMDQIGSNTNWRLDKTLEELGGVSVQWLADAVSRRRDMAEQAEDKDELVRPLGFTVKLGQFVLPVTAEDRNDSEVLDAIDALIETALGSVLIEYYLPELLRDADPDGLVVPTVVSRKIAGEESFEKVRRLAKFASEYSLDSEAWRTVASPVLSRATASSESEQRSLFQALKSSAPTTFWSERGEVPEVFIKDVDEARQRLEEEEEPEFKAYWEWFLEIAKYQLNDAKEKAKEERGE